jgi:hypothetical protein
MLHKNATAVNSRFRKYRLWPTASSAFADRYPPRRARGDLAGVIQGFAID